MEYIRGSVLSLFVAVMEVVTKKLREGLPWELLYADDLVLVAQSIEKLREKVGDGGFMLHNPYFHGARTVPNF